MSCPEQTVVELVAKCTNMWPSPKDARTGAKKNKKENTHFDHRGAQNQTITDVGLGLGAENGHGAAHALSVHETLEAWRDGF